MASASQRIYFVSLGCPKNQVDTELMLGQVQAALAFTEASIAYTADLTVAQIHAGGWDWEQFTDWLTHRLEYAPLVAELAHLAEQIDEQEGVLCAS